MDTQFDQMVNTATALMAGPFVVFLLVLCVATILTAFRR